MWFSCQNSAFQTIQAIQAIQAIQNQHQDLVAQGDWRKIKQLAQEAMAMGELMVENNGKHINWYKLI